MAAIIGSIHITSVKTSAIVNFGDVNTIAPYTTTTTFAGPGSYNEGDVVNVKNGPSKTLFHPDVYAPEVGPS
ncbi:spore germination protein GerPA/GerPF [Salsuginibacillus halophilus]|uniref:Spore germination protein GerPA/GerPF n=1 Tax=Salsuginibacillus halophilus TaxID=517424 RepID=A0A2P8HYL4_9BACI|nr:spore germination protein [Salsuginibacillus halophilus]PSL51297.1 spore germination protein GerPA/GerPF [Salsuginibacillus halophilus]